MNGRDYIWDGNDFLPIGKTIVFETYQHTPPLDIFGQVDPQVTFPPDALRAVSTSRVGLIQKTRPGFGLIIYSESSGGGPGVNKYDSNQDPAAEAMNITWLWKFLRARDETQHGILGQADEQHGAAYKRRDTILFSNKRLQFYSRTGEGGAGAHWIYDAHTVNLETGDTIDVDYGVIKD